MLDTIASVGWPVLDRFRIGDTIEISPHGLGIAIGFLVGSWPLMRLAGQREIPETLANSIVFWSVIGSLSGRPGRLRDRACIRLRQSPRLAQDLGGGISLLGGIAGATIANAVNIKRQEYRFRFFQVADTIAPCLALGIAVGRIGDLIVGDHLGKPASWLLAWTYEGGTLAPPFSCSGDSCTATLHGGLTETFDRAGATLSDAAGKVLEQGIGVHQTALYDMLLAGILFTFLWWFIRSPRREGVVALTFALCVRVHAGCWRIRSGSTSASDRSRARSGPRWTAAMVASGLLIYWAVSPRPGPTTPGRAERASERGAGGGPNLKEPGGRPKPAAAPPLLDPAIRSSPARPSSRRRSRRRRDGHVIDVPSVDPGAPVHPEVNRNRTVSPARIRAPVAARSTIDVPHELTSSLASVPVNADCPAIGLVLPPAAVTSAWLYGLKRKAVVGIWL